MMFYTSIGWSGGTILAKFDQFWQKKTVERSALDIVYFCNTTNRKNLQVCLLFNGEMEMVNNYLLSSYQYF